MPWRCCFGAIPSPPLRYCTSKAISTSLNPLLAKPYRSGSTSLSALHSAPSIQQPAQQSRREIDVKQKAKPEAVGVLAGREQIANSQKAQDKCDNRAEEYSQVFQQISKRWFTQTHYSSGGSRLSWFSPWLHLAQSKG